MDNNFNPKIGEKTRFSSDNQPSPEKKRVPKIKSLIKKSIREHYDAFDEKMAKGDYQFWKVAIEQIEGEPDKRIGLNMPPVQFVIPAEPESDDEKI